MEDTKKKPTPAAKPKPVASEVPGVNPVPKKVTVGKQAVLIFKATKKMTLASFSAAAKMLREEQEAAGIKIVLKPYSVELEK